MLELSSLNTDELTFPLPFMPSEIWKKGKAFGAHRDGPKDNPTRVHAGCDLIAPAGTEVYAVAKGTVYMSRSFSMPKKNEAYKNVHVWQIMIDHGSFHARYCELRCPAEGIAVGVEVEQGQLIGYVGQLLKQAMLHFEMYKGPSTQNPSQIGNLHYLYVPVKPYQRRSDIINPGPFLYGMLGNILPRRR